MVGQASAPLNKSMLHVEIFPLRWGVRNVPTCLLIPLTDGIAKCGRAGLADMPRALLRVRSIVSTRQIRRCSRYRRLDLCQGRLQGGFLRVVEGRFQYCAAFAFEPLKDLVRRDFAHKYE